MRILILTGTYLPATNGVAMAIDQEREGLEQLGHKVVIVAPKHPRQQNNTPGVFRYASIPNPLSPDEPIPLIPSPRELKHLLQSRRIDLIHCHTTFHIGDLAAKLAKENQLPLVMTMHTNLDEYTKQPDTLMSLIPHKMRRFLVKGAAYKPYTKASLVVFLSHFLAKKFHKRYPNVPFTVIPTGISPLTLSPKGKHALRRSLGLPLNQTILLYVGRLSPEKNLLQLIRVVKYLPENYSLILVGDGPLRKKLGKIVARHGWENRVYFTGTVSRKSIPLYSQAADIFVSASISENQPLTFFEAMYCGLPLVVYKSAAANEWVPKKIGRQTAPSPKALSQIIKSLSPTDLKQMGVEGKKFSQTLRSDELTLRLTKVFETLITPR